MHIRTAGIARIKDKLSGEIYEIEASELEWDAVGGSERRMGPETEWQAATTHPSLGDLVWKLWEYPAGAENYQDQDLNGHELVQNFEIGLEDDPEEPDEFDDPFDIASRALAAGREPIFGSRQEQLQRQDVLDALKKLVSDAAAGSAKHGGIGHNNPPSDGRFSDDELREMRELMQTIQTEFQKPKPDTSKVVETASKMRQIGHWILARTARGADAFAETLGKAGGVAVIASLVASDPGSAWTQIAQIVAKIGIWLLTAMGMM